MKGFYFTGSNNEIMKGKNCITENNRLNTKSLGAVDI
jgi:hypothetical protein